MDLRVNFGDFMVELLSSFYLSVDLFLPKVGEPNSAPPFKVDLLPNKDVALLTAFSERCDLGGSHFVRS